MVDRFGPQVFKNFDKMKIVKFGSKNSEKGGSQAGHKRPEPMAREAGADSLRVPGSTRTEQNTPQKTTKRAQFGGSENPSEKGDQSDSASRRSLGPPRSETNKSETDYNLEYRDEIELNQAFNMFKDV